MRAVRRRRFGTEAAMPMPTSLPSQVRDAIQDLCILVVDNTTLKNGIHRGQATALMHRLERTEEIVLTETEIELIIEMADAVANAIVDGRPLRGGRVLTRVVERVIASIADALGYPGHGRI